MFIKIRGEEEVFKITDLKDFIGEEEIPGYDHDVKWTSRRDRAPRRCVSSSRSSSPVNRNPEKPAGTISRETLPQPPSMDRQLRQLSLNSNDGAPSKRRKDDGSEDPVQVMTSEKQ